MSISLKALYDQVQGIKNSGLSISEWNPDSHGYVLFSNGLLINWGTDTTTFKKSYSNQCVVVLSCPHKNATTSYAEHWSVNTITKTGFTIHNTGYSDKNRFIAIGYLITNSIRSLLAGDPGWL